LRRISLSIGLGLLLASQAFAQYSGQFSSAATTPQGASRLSTYFGLYEHAIGILGQYRYGIGAYTDFGIKLGVIDFDRPTDETGIDLAGDFKYRVMEKQLRDPFNLSLGGVMEFSTTDSYDIFSAGLNAIGSYPVQLRNGHYLDPYGRLNLRVQRNSPEFGNSDTDFEIGLNLGTSYEITKTIRALGEFQFDDPFAFYFGFDFDL
jgi:hypothetical protein